MNCGRWNGRGMTIAVMSSTAAAAAAAAEVSYFWTTLLGDVTPNQARESQRTSWREASSIGRSRCARRWDKSTSPAAQRTALRMRGSSREKRKPQLHAWRRAHIQQARARDDQGYDIILLWLQPIILRLNVWLDRSWSALSRQIRCLKVT